MRARSLLLVFLVGWSLLACSAGRVASCEGEGCAEASESCPEGCPSGQLCAAGECVDRCPGHSTACGGECVDTRYDPDHCGACGAACEDETYCSEGTCQTGCSGQRPDQCGDRCVDLLTEPTACGSCERTCGEGELCSEGKCLRECGGRTPDQCGQRCVDLASDAEFCGDCETQCAPGEACVAGACQAGCDEERPLQCGSVCVDPESDARFCGGCEIRCPSDQYCSEGECVEGCPSPEQSVCDGECVDVKRDAEHCGSCGSRCRAGTFCSEGICSKNCGGTFPDACGTLCTDTRVDPAHCGACANACEAHEVCREGECAPSCGGATPDVCAGGCVHLDSDVRHCGSCENSCKPGEQCVQGSCEAVCSPPSTLCDGGCVDTLSDADHCGACGRGCAAGQQCRDARCAETVVDVVAGGAATCAELSNGQFSCWGDNQEGILGPEETAEGWAASRLAGLSGPVQQLALGRGHACALVEGSAGPQVECWGGNGFGETGSPISAPVRVASPVSLPSEETVAGVAAGENRTCAWLESGKLWCWGAGWNTLYSAPEPTEVPFVEGVTGMCPGVLDFTCARLDAEQQFGVHCWGMNYFGVLGAEPPSPVDPAHALIAGLQPLTVSVDPRQSISCSWYSACAIVGNGEVACWGADVDGQLGRGESVEPEHVPVVVPLPSPARALTGGNSYHCALLEDATVMCWGRHELDGPFTSSSTPRLVELPVAVTRLSSRKDSNFALSSTGELWSWGPGVFEMLNRQTLGKYEPAPCCDRL